MGSDLRVLTSSPPLVALAGWLCPGSGYWLIGQTGRGLVTGITIIVLFLSGLLIGGVRVVEVPGFDINTGKPSMVPVPVAAVDRSGNPVMAPEMVVVTDPKTGETRREMVKKWSLEVSPLNEIRDKPWSVPQAMAGPIAIAAGVASVNSAAPVDGSSTIPIAPQTHARINELGSLYLSVAGLLNLMVIIDSTWRASQINAPLSGEENA